MSDLEAQMELTRLREQLREAKNILSRHANFIEALAITILDEEDWDEAQRMIAEADGREVRKETGDGPHPDPDS